MDRSAGSKSSNHGKKRLKASRNFERLEVLYWLHLSLRNLVKQSPANDGCVRGTFALRSPVRPNPIGTAIATVVGIDPGWTPPQGGHRTALAFRCDDPAEVDKVYAELTAAWYHGHQQPWDAFWGQRYAVVHDPDGNAVDLFAPLPS